jgi:hypothetical protein
VRNISDKCCTENQNTRFMVNNIFLSFKNRAIYEIMWKNTVEPGRPQVKKERKRIACWDTQGYKHTLSEYVRLIAFPLHQCLQERASC